MPEVRVCCFIARTCGTPVRASRCERDNFTSFFCRGAAEPGTMGRYTTVQACEFVWIQEAFVFFVVIRSLFLCYLPPSGGCVKKSVSVCEGPRCSKPSLFSPPHHTLVR